MDGAEPFREQVGDAFPTEFIGGVSEELGRGVVGVEDADAVGGDLHEAGVGGVQRQEEAGFHGGAGAALGPRLAPLDDAEHQEGPGDEAEAGVHAFPEAAVNRGAHGGGSCLSTNSTLKMRLAIARKMTTLIWATKRTSMSPPKPLRTPMARRWPGGRLYCQRRATTPAARA